MKFALDSNHLDFFEKNQYIEFDSILTENELKGLQSHLSEALLGSMQLNKKIGPLTEEGQFSAGHDLYQKHPFFRRMVVKRQWAEFAAALIKRKSLRLGYDQFFPGFLPLPVSKENPLSSYTKLLGTSQSLEQISSIQDILCGLILCIKAPKCDSASENDKFFSLKPGSGVFIGPKLPIHFSELTRRQDYQYLLVAYASPSAVYILNEHDPFSYFLKNYGYAYGDKLKEQFHPIICRLR